MNNRITFLFCFIVLLWGALILRAGFLQFMPNEKMEALQAKQFHSKINLESRRGAIVDRNGRELALSTAVFSIYADPQMIKAKKDTARRLAKIVKESPDSIYKKIKDKNKRFVWIKRQTDESSKLAIEKLKIQGVSFVQEWKRVYPNETLLAHTLGFLGNDGQALEGVELAFDKKLRGDQRKVVVKKDARGVMLLNDGLLFTETPEGSEVQLTIDYDLQFRLDQELSRAVHEFEADNAIGIILDAKTSAILAMSTLPAFDANEALKYDGEVRKNKAITDAFEPGSTMKTFVIAKALQEKIATPNKKYFCENGRFKVADRIVREADSQHKFENLSVTEILALSSNIGTTKIAFELGEQNLRSALNDFGFGRKTGLELADSKGILNPLPWGQHLLSNISFGHGVAATPLQMANAYAAIANGGILNTPYIINSWTDPNTGKNETHQMGSGERVIDKEVADSMRMMLTAVTDKSGTGFNARVNGYIVAGKTGTAQKVNPKGRGYLPNAYVSSFAGFIPANDPHFVIYVLVDNPRKAYYGSQVAAPIFSRLASYAVRKEGIPPVLIAEKPAQLKETSGIVANLNIKENITQNRVPDLSNMTLREAIRSIQGSDINLKVRGAGLIKRMIPEPGSILDKDKPITVILE